MIEVTGNKFKLGEPVGIEPVRKVGQVVSIAVHKDGSNANYSVEWINNDLAFQRRWFSEDDLLDIKKKEEPVTEAPTEEALTQPHDPVAVEQDNAPQPINN